jgi:aminopeptidase
MPLSPSVDAQRADTIPMGELERFADLAVRGGVNLQEGQLLGLYSHSDMAWLARVFAAKAYQVGASGVMIHYFDSQLQALEAKHGWADPPATDEAGEAIVRRLIAERGAAIKLHGDAVHDPYHGAPADRVATVLAANEKRYSRMIDAGCNWMICPAPTAAWASDAYDVPDTARLWADLHHALRLDEDDPLGAWRRRLTELDAQAAQLSRRRFSAIRFSGPGTDLHVPLHSDARWITTRFETPAGVRFQANLPTEEIFTTPDFRGVRGTVRATRPMRVNRTRVSGLRIRIEAGTIVEASADEGVEAVRAQIAGTRGANRLGEVALVDGRSRVGQLGLVFLNALLDENATCHIAWGDSFIEAFPPSFSALTADECQTRGINRSGIHTDVMIGGPEITVTGIAEDGTETRILRNNQWLLEED